MITISLPNEQRVRFRGLLRRAGRREIGGIVMGEQISPDSFRIVDFSVDVTTGTAAHFVRSPEQHTAALQAFYERTGSDFKRFNYLGEWHSHPSFPALPSEEDMASMQSLVDGEREINFASLMIIKLKYRLMLQASAYMFVRQRHPMRVTLTD
jgi:[CysO sulfur-carrier protein]-S-L-cysteine hydrolase